jgi:hypothetical protein
MDHTETSPDRVAKAVFWLIFAGSMAFVIGVLILIR